MHHFIMSWLPTSDLEDGASLSSTSTPTTSSSSEDSLGEMLPVMLFSDERDVQELEDDISRVISSSRTHSGWPALSVALDQTLEEFTWNLLKELQLRTENIALRKEIQRNMGNFPLRVDVLISVIYKLKLKREFQNEQLLKSFLRNGSCIDEVLQPIDLWCVNRRCALNCRSMYLLEVPESERLDSLMDMLKQTEELLLCLQTPHSSGLTGTEAKRLLSWTITEVMETLHFCSGCWTSILLESQSRVDMLTGAREQFSLLRTSYRRPGTQRMIIAPYVVDLRELWTLMEHRLTRALTNWRNGYRSN